MIVKIMSMVSVDSIMHCFVLLKCNLDYLLILAPYYLCISIAQLYISFLKYLSGINSGSKIYFSTPKNPNDYYNMFEKD
jgi:hypothetical protein